LLHRLYPNVGIFLSARTVLIELDSVHTRAVERAVALDLMPCVAGLLASGSRCKLDYEIPLQVAAWQSAQTGLSAAEHQFISYDNPIPGSYGNTRGFGPGSISSKYWERLSGAGKRVLVLNALMVVTPSEGINGVQVCGFSTHVSGDYNPTVSYPRQIAVELLEKFPNDLFHREDWGSLAFLDPARLTHSVCENLKRKRQVFADLLRQEEWDHAHIGLDDLHGIGHMLIRSNERDIDTAGGPASTAGGEFYMQACAELDRTISEIVSAAGEDATVMLVALGGIGAENHWSHQLDSLISPALGVGKPPKNTIYNRGGWAWNRLPHRIKQWLLPLKSSLRDKYIQRRRRHAPAFTSPLNEESGAIRINLAGREPEGTVESLAQYHELCSKIAEALLDWRDTESGTPLVDEVIHVPDALGFDPMQPSSLPDLLVNWSRQRTISVVECAGFGTCRRAFGPARLGDHVIDGFVISSEEVRAGNLSSLSVLDIAPALLARHGVQ
jgi:predicted AlkP superfamily phosphohydrolase/phosphomutase